MKKKMKRKKVKKKKLNKKIFSKIKKLKIKLTELFSNLAINTIFSHPFLIMFLSTLSFHNY